MQSTRFCYSCENQIPERQQCPFCLIGKAISVIKYKKCKICTFQNHGQLITCQMCGQNLEQLQDQLQLPVKVQKLKSIISCQHCGFQNALSNQVCLNCQVSLFQEKKEVRKCPICNFKVQDRNYDEHYKNCLLSSEAIMKQVQQQNMVGCTYCHEKFLPDFIEKHQSKCQKKPKYEDLIVDKISRMTKLQIQAITYMHKKSQKQHNSARSGLLTRIKNLGYKNQDLDNLQFYIQNYAPIIIHIHVSKHMEFFVKDTHYRSQFETNKSSGSLSRPSRIQWEDRMFDKKYSQAKDFERVKYGTINFTNDPKGVNCCSGYGPSYFLLKDHVRSRCTFTDKDSSGSDSVIGTFKYCFRVLSKLNDNELKAALNGSRAIQVNSSVVSTYKQIQIHGPIQFAKDIERIYVKSQQVKGNQKLLDMVYEFSKKNGVEHDFI